MEFWPLKSLFENLRVHRDSNSQSWSPFGRVRVHSHSLSCTPRSIWSDSRAPFWLTTLQPLALVANLKLRLRQGVSNFSKLWLARLWGPITLCANLRLRWGLKQSCSLHWELSKGMSHAIFMQANWGKSRLLVVGSQIANLTPDLSFGHNLCFKCPNGSCKPISDI